MTDSQSSPTNSDSIFLDDDVVFSSDGNNSDGTAVSTTFEEPQTASERPLLEIRRLHRHFGKLKAVNDISFKLHAGQVMGFIGPNGAGKTTAMRIIATLDVPTAGDVFVGGYSVVDDPDKVRHILGFMPDGFGRYANVNVTEYLDFFARAYGFTGQERRDAVERVLVFTELRKIADKPITSLSKGMSQRLGLGRTLIHDPDVLILDEPAAGLDPRARVELRELIHLLATQMNKAVLISSHILTELGEICDSAAIIEAGRILAHGSIKELQTAQRAARGQATTVTLKMRVIDKADDMERWLLQQPFVEMVTVSAYTVSFEFSGDEAAQHQILKGAIEQEFSIVEFLGHVETLEDAFMNITKGIVQ